MAPTAAIIVPTQDRAAYLDVALASLEPQATAAGAELVVVDDGSRDATREVAARYGARIVAHAAPRGLNAARNSGVDATTAELLCFVDDDVEVRPGWLHALRATAAALPDEVGVFTGPIHARFEDHRWRSCGRHAEPITTTDLGPDDRDADHAWGANMAIRRTAFARAGRFDEGLHLTNAGDEQEWQDRFVAAGGRIRYVAAAALDHRRAGDDARLRSLCASAYRRGRAVKRFDRVTGRQVGAGEELRVLAGCAVHGPRFACMGGPVMTAHSLGRVRELLAEALRATALPPATPDDDFLAGASGHVAGRKARLLRAQDAWLDLRSARTRRAARARAAATPRRRVLVCAVVRDDVPGLWGAAARELQASHHDVVLATTTPQGRGKFEAVDALLAAHDLTAFDAVLLCDDDVDLPRGLLDVLLAEAEAHDLVLAQPAHRRHSHAAWPVTLRSTDPRTTGRRTTFVEIGPVTLFRGPAVGAFLPFPPGLRMGWGLDAHWAAVARDRGWALGVVDAVPVGHTLRPAAAGYPREQAAAEARRFLDGRPYVRRAEVGTVERW